MLLSFTTVLIFALHLLAMNAAAAGPLASMAFDWRRRERELSHAAARFLSGAALAAYLLGMLLGGGLAALLWSREEALLIYSLLEGKIFYGVIELVFSLLLMAGHYAWMRYASAAGRWRSRSLRGLIVLLATSNLLYHFPPLFAVAARIRDGWRPPGETVTPALFREQLLAPEVASQSIHFLLASLAAAGILVLVFALRTGRSGGADSEAATAVARLGGRMALLPTLLQILVGMWVLLSLPRTAQTRLMGGDLPATGLFLLSLAAALALMHQLASIALGDCDRRTLVRAIAWFAITVLLMTGVLYVA